MEQQEAHLRQILTGFVNDPPDGEYQLGFLAASLMIANEVYGIRWDDPLWQQADALISGAAAAMRDIEVKKRTPLTVIVGGKSE